MERRDFLQKMSLAASAMLVPAQLVFGKDDRLGKLLPLRPLGNTGEMVTMLGVGGWHVGAVDEKEAQRIIETAIEEGVRFFDTAHAYQKGESEIRYGKWLTPKYRKDIFLMTKSGAPNYDKAKEQLNLSLERLQTDVIDLWQLHSLESPEDVENRVKNGVFKLAKEAKKEGKIRHIGFTGHSDPNALLRLMELEGESGLLAAVQCPINPVDALSHESNIEKVIPKALENNIGILAMKTLAAGRIVGQQFWGKKLAWESEKPIAPNYMSLEEVFHFVWSLPISTLITGAESSEQLREKIRFAKSAMDLSEKERLQLIDKLSEYAELDDIEYYKKV